jgi:hypothetical protein
MSETPSPKSQVRIEEVLEAIAAGKLGISYAVYALHAALDNVAFFFKLLMTYGSGQDLIERHNAWVIVQIREEDPLTCELWGRVLKGMPYPIMPLHVELPQRLQVYNRRLLIWAQQQHMPAGAVNPVCLLKPEEFLIFRMAYEPVVSDAVVSASEVMERLSEQRRSIAETNNAITDLRNRMAAHERAIAEFRAANQTLQRRYQPPAQPQQVPSQQPPQQQQPGSVPRVRTPAGTPHVLHATCRYRRVPFRHVS